MVAIPKRIVFVSRASLQTCWTSAVIPPAVSRLSSQAIATRVGVISPSYSISFVLAGPHGHGHGHGRGVRSEERGVSDCRWYETRRCDW
jgi:hypothetical protein